MPHGIWRSIASLSPMSTRVRQSATASRVPRVVHAPQRSTARIRVGFDDVNPPVHAWAAMRVFEIDASNDFEFLERLLPKLLINFTWWVNRKDAAGNNVLEGGFLGLDNIGPIDWSA